nr:uncharacterized protein LOC120968831 [Aegilops tauschii subsp. strangulata]
MASGSARPRDGAAKARGYRCGHGTARPRRAAHGYRRGHGARRTATGAATAGSTATGRRGHSARRAATGAATARGARLPARPRRAHGAASSSPGDGSRPCTGSAGATTGAAAAATPHDAASCRPSRRRRRRQQDAVQRACTPAGYGCGFVDGDFQLVMLG